VSLPGIGDHSDEQSGERIGGEEEDESAVELILREGFSREYGARYLERVMDFLLGDPTAEKILGRKTTSEGILRVTAVDGRGLEFRSSRLRS